MDAPVTQSLEFGRYRVIEELSRGAEGVVYKARDPVIDRLVTLKTIDIGLPSDAYEAWRRRVDRELKSAGRLNHPNIVTIYDVGTHADIAYLAMEFMDGRTLREVLDAGRLLPPARVADIAAQVAEGLDFVHQRGIVHRDIKPENIMLLRSGRVKITDFGIARLSRGSHTQIVEVVASPRYTSPEQVTGDVVDERSDIFSLGAVLYEMLTGAPPFAGGRLHEIAQQVVNEMPPVPSARNRKVPVAFDAIVAKALAKRPAERYGNIRELVADLRLAAHATPGAAAEAAAGPESAATVAPGIPVDAAAAPESAARVAPGIPVDAAAAPESAAVAVADAVAPPPESSASTALAVIAAVEVRPHRRARAAYLVTGLLLLATAGWVLLSPPTVRPAQVSVTVAPLSAEEPTTKPALPERAQGEASAQAAVAHTAPARDSPALAPKVAPQLALAISPWGEVYVDGKRKGVSPPLRELRLPPGRYVVEIRNSTFPPYRQSIDLRHGGHAKIRHKFQ